MFRHSLRFCVTMSAAALLWCASDTVSLAAKPPVLIPNTAWATVGKVKGTASHFGGFSAPGQGIISFSPAQGEGFPATGTFNCEIGDLDPEVEFQLTVPGTYSQDERGKIVLTPENVPIEAQIDQVVRDLLLSELGIVPDSLTVVIVKNQAKAKTNSSTKLGEFINLKFQAKAVVTVVYEAQTGVVKVNMSYNGKGGHAL